ncbi:kinase-like protein [Didymella exigua CBS 183.55]|uniref:Kinase-like protein n=1 Tax=Didymella exigua CBS 183.55 TaxID=1150837 RepID=A0A6A5R9C4_9PLEO|nr:kinase-like protein [Didymella exigua CBS 183.55]KAF1924143.1 kinase-like protein [Didymella exigua CBS 183.55]
MAQIALPRPEIPTRASTHRTLLTRSTVQLPSRTNERAFSQNSSLGWSHQPSSQERARPFSDTFPYDHYVPEESNVPEARKARSSGPTTYAPSAQQVARSPLPEKIIEITHGDETTQNRGGMIRRYATSAASTPASKALAWKVRTLAHQHRSVDWHVPFLPSADLERLIAGNAVLSALSAAKREKPIIGSPVNYRRILAVLHLMKRPSKIHVFLTRGVCDADLPLEPLDDGSTIVRTLSLRSKNNKKAPTITFNRSEDAQGFCEQQWSVIAHKFTKLDRFYVRLEKEIVLPYMEYRRTERGGGEGEIYLTRIHPDYHPWHRETAECKRNRKTCLKKCNVFAVKILSRYDTAAFTKEVSTFEKLQRETHTHEHLVNLLAAYEQNKRYHFVFPWADVDLLRYWQQDAKPDPSSERASWLATQCHGLAQALDRIHHYKTFSGRLLQFGFDQTGHAVSTNALEPSNRSKQNRRYYGRHGDLKPENILWFPDSRFPGSYGILRITDFGSAQFATEESKRGRVPNSPSYHSPEYALTQDYSIACDIWALGCIYLEFITWYFGGWTAVHHFSLQRRETDHTLANIRSDKFFSIKDDGAVRAASVKHEVTDKIDALWVGLRQVRDKYTQEMFEKLLNMVKTEMLIVSPLTAPAHGRKSAGNIFRELSKYCPPEPDPSRCSTFEPQQKPASQQNIVTRLKRRSIIRN